MSSTRSGYWVLAGLLAVAPCAAAGDMVDPAIDGLAGPFSYLAKPSGLLGGIGGSAATQVTWEGALYTGAAELCLVTGDPPRPVAVRIKRLGGGHLPMVHTTWVEGDVKFTVSAFAVALSPGADPANLVRLHVARLGDSGQPASIGFGLRHSGLDHRAKALQKAEFDPAGRYEFGRGCALIDGRVVCVMPARPPDRQYAVAGEPYRQPFTGSEHGVRPATAVLLALWDLGKQAELTVDLKMPWTPLPADAHGALEALRAATYDSEAEQVVEGWETELGRGMRPLLPETKPLETYEANLAYLLMSVEIPKEAGPRFHDHLRGTVLSAGESAALAEALDRSGRHDLVRNCLQAWLDQQRPDGSFSPGGDPWEHSRLMIAVVEHIWLTGDRPWAEQVYPKIRSGAEWIVSALKSGTISPGDRAFVAAAEALGEVGELAALIGKPEEASVLKGWRDEALGAIEGASPGQPLPAAVLPSILGLNRGLPDSPESGFLGCQAEHTSELCRRLHLSYAEGLATEEGQLAPLVTMDLARLHAVRGEQEQAIRDLYAMLVHTGSCHEGFAGGVRPWSGRDSGEAWSPDPRFAGAYMDLLRDLLIREQRDELHLFSAVSPEWLQAGQMVGVHNAPTSFGLVTAAMQIEKGGAAFLMAADWHALPSRVVVHLPYCVDLVSASADVPGLKQMEGPPPAEYESSDLPAAGSKGVNHWLAIRPDTTRLTIRWTLRPGAQLSYEAAVEEWREQYAARYRDYVNAGGRPVPVEAVPLR